MNELIPKQENLPVDIDGLRNQLIELEVKFAAECSRLRSLGWRPPKKETLVYFIKAQNSLIKIGFTNNIEYRMNTLKTMSPLKLELLGTWPGNRKLETIIHQNLKPYRQHGEWFAFNSGFIEKLKIALGEYINEYGLN